MSAFIECGVTTAINMHRATSSVDIGGGLRRYIYSMNKLKLLLFVASFVLLIVSVPIDILRHQYVWSQKLDRQKEEADMYRALVGHCDCFQRDNMGKLPACIRAYSMVWSLVTVIQCLITLFLLLYTDWCYVHHLLTGSYTATVVILLALFTDCGALTEDDCNIAYLLVPNIMYTIALLFYAVRQRKTVLQRPRTGLL